MALDFRRIAARSVEGHSVRELRIGDQAFDLEGSVTFRQDDMLLVDARDLDFLSSARRVMVGEADAALVDAPADERAVRDVEANDFAASEGRGDHAFSVVVHHTGAA